MELNHSKIFMTFWAHCGGYRTMEFELCMSNQYVLNVCSLMHFASRSWMDRLRTFNRKKQNFDKELFYDIKLEKFPDYEFFRKNETKLNRGRKLCINHSIHINRSCFESFASTTVNILIEAALEFKRRRKMRNAYRLRSGKLVCIFLFPLLVKNFFY